MQSLEAHVFLKGNYLTYCAAPESPHCNFHRLIKKTIRNAELRRPWIGPDRFLGKSCITFLAFCWELPTQPMVMRTRAKLWNGKVRVNLYGRTLFHAMLSSIQNPFSLSVFYWCPYIRQVPSWGLAGRAENTTGRFDRCLRDGLETLVPRAIGTARSRAAWQQGWFFDKFW